MSKLKQYINMLYEERESVIAIIGNKKFNAKDYGANNLSFSPEIIKEVAQTILDNKNISSDHPSYDYIRRLAIGTNRSPRITHYIINKSLFDNYKNKKETPIDKDEYNKGLIDMYTFDPKRKSPHWTGD